MSRVRVAAAKNIKNAVVHNLKYICIKAMHLTRVTIPVGETEQVSAVVAVPDQHQPGKGTGIIIAHGAGFVTIRLICQNLLKAARQRSMTK